MNVYLDIEDDNILSKCYEADNIHLDYCYDNLQKLSFDNNRLCSAYDVH